MPSFEEAFKAATEEYTYAPVPNALEHDEWTLIEDEIWDTTRWSIINRAIVKYEDQFFAITYESPATEYQEGGDFDDYQLNEVEPVEVTKIEYKIK